MFAFGFFMFAFWMQSAKAYENKQDYNLNE